VLTSNGEPIPFVAEYFKPMHDSTPLLSQPNALRERFRHDGYVLLRGVLDPDAVSEQRAAYFSLVDPLILEPGTPLGAGIYSGVAAANQLDHGVPGHPAYDYVRSKGFLEFGKAPELRTVAEILLEGTVKQLPRKIVRHFYNGSRRASRAHTDREYMTEGSDKIVTAWVPIGDCPLAMGGLVYLENSMALDDDLVAAIRTRKDREKDQRPISHDLLWTARQSDRHWLWTDFAAGDVAIHSPHIVHASMDTTTPAMRLSADFRFVCTAEVVDQRWTKAWAGNDGA
jgi:ectoine hydroxylase-related dioxygenase (phytanoyl-CoA dioxygenase family)